MPQTSRTWGRAVGPWEPWECINTLIPAVWERRHPVLGVYPQENRPLFNLSQVTWLVSQLKDFHVLHCMDALMDLGPEEDQETSSWTI